MEEGGGDILLRRLQEDNDLFGVGSSDSEDERQISPVRDDDGENRRKEEDEEQGSLPSPTSPVEKKSRSKSRPSKPRKSLKVEVDQLHSESQRVLREAPLNLPHYQPTEKTIDSFLTKVRSRQASIASQSSAKKSTLEMMATPNSCPPPRLSHLSTPTAVPCSTPPPTQPSATPLSVPTALSSQHSASTPAVGPQRGSSSRRNSLATLSRFLQSGAAPPRLSGREDFSMDEDELPGAQVMQQRLQAQLAKSPSASQKAKHGSMASILPEETFAKLKNTPGALRAEWKKVMREQLTQDTRQRVQAQRELRQEQKKLEEEEYGPDEEEEEEMTDEDMESSDEEFAGEFADKEAKEESDVCSDLDEEEGEKVAREMSEERNKSPGSSHEEEEGESEEEEEEEEEDDEDEITDVRTSAKKVRASRIIDSDESDDEDSGTSNTSISIEQCGKKAGIILDENSSFPRLRLDSEETLGSESLLPPPVTDQESSGFPPSSQTYCGPSVTDGKSWIGKGVGQPTEGGHDNTVSKSGVVGSSKKGKDFYMESESDKGQKKERISESQEERPTKMLEDETCIDSQDMTFPWSQSLPLAQRHSLTQKEPVIGTPDDLLREESQWQATPIEPTPRLGDEETCILDPDGFISHREKHSSPGIALLEALGKSSAPENAPGDNILDLCSGKFPDTMISPARRGTPSSESPLTPLSASSSTDDEASLEVPYSGPMTGVGGGDCKEPVHPGSSKDLFDSSASVSEKRNLTNQTFGGGGTASHQESIFERADSSDRDNAVLRWAQRHQGVAPKGNDHNSSSSSSSSHDTVGVSEVAGRDGSDMFGHLDDDEDDDGDMPTIKRRKVVVQQSKAERLAEFVQSEAELSGEDVGPDEEEEEEEDEEAMLDQYLAEEEDLGISKEELWDQVAKAHMKHTASDDKADIQDLKERFLKDGELFEDGLTLKNGFFRSRHFAQGSEAGSLELFSEDRDSEGEDEGGGVVGRPDDSGAQEIAKMRRDRIEREEFMRKCRENENSFLQDENSRSILNLINDTSSQSMITTPKLRNFKPCNSFLRKTKSTPSSSFQQNNTSSSAMATPTNVGSVSNRGFVFQKSTPVIHKDETAISGKKPPSKFSNKKQFPAKKKPRFTTSLSVQTPSVFKSLYQS